MARIEEMPKPTIMVARHTRTTDSEVACLLLGLEEQGVPFEQFTLDELNPLELAHEASLRSVLGVGIGVSLDYVVVTTDKLPPGRPYLAGHLNQSAEADRVFGGNAARLVKRLPLQAVPHRSEP
ncbi:glycerol dehydratase reactivase beta/small subunit family protein [Propionibacteriaceae bacterium Y1923]|uniref:glycerol dehydratase reactivase beta/small subunit family protein n=1 Tax=Aestuariimicrobium sp. Y1814 TaxID=3418742 RepID=UPI003C18A53A